MDSVRLTLSDIELEQLIRFCHLAAVRNEPARLRLQYGATNTHALANARMRSTLLTRLQLKLAIAQLKAFGPYKVSVPTEQALALVAEWTGPISDGERALLSVADVVGTIDAATA